VVSFYRVSDFRFRNTPLGSGATYGAKPTEPFSSGAGIRLPSAQAPATVARRMMLIGHSPIARAPVFVLRRRGGSRKSAVALLGVNTSSKNPRPTSNSDLVGTIVHRMSSVEVWVLWKGSTTVIVVWMASSFESVYECVLP